MIDTASPAPSAGHQKGFTLVELLVVIIIIGILAAIAIPAFLNQRTKGYDATVKSDLKSAVTAFETHYADGLRYPTSRAQLADAGFNPSQGVSYAASALTAPRGGYLVYAKHEGSSQVWFTSSYTGSVPRKSTCASLSLTSACVAADAPLGGTTGITLVALT